jgi:hypothetical protein
MKGTPMPIATTIADAGARWLAALSASIDEADPDGIVAPRSRLLCAALGLLSSASARSLGASDEAAEEAGLAGAALSLLTKIDDEVIDSLAFHGGPTTPRDEVERRTRAFLAPTEIALFAGARGEPLGAVELRDRPRARYAHAVGVRLATLGASRDRLEHVLASVALGWHVQARAARVLTADPSVVDEVEVRAATRSISGAWLGMITLVGELARGATRPLHDDEVEAIWDWGSFIQRADALCDLEKDRRDGLVSTFVGHAAHRRSAPANGTPTTAELYRIVARHGIDRASVPAASERAALGRRLSALAPVEELLSWIFAMLYGRYEAHPLAVVAREEVATCSAR